MSEMELMQYKIDFLEKRLELLERQLSVGNGAVVPGVSVELLNSLVDVIMRTRMQTSPDALPVSVVAVAPVVAPATTPSCQESKQSAAIHTAFDDITCAARRRMMV